MANADNYVLDKIQVTTILNSLPPSWDHIVTTLTRSGKEAIMISLPVLLVLEEVRKKIKITIWWWLKQFLNQELLNNDGKIRHFCIRKKNFKESGQISKDIIENQNILVIIVEDLDILWLIVLIIIIIITKIMNQCRL